MRQPQTRPMQSQEGGKKLKQRKSFCNHCLTILYPLTKFCVCFSTGSMISSALMRDPQRKQDTTNLTPTMHTNTMEKAVKRAMRVMTSHLPNIIIIINRHRTTTPSLFFPHNLSIDNFKLFFLLFVFDTV